MAHKPKGKSGRDAVEGATNTVAKGGSAAAQAAGQGIPDFQGNTKAIGGYTSVPRHIAQTGGDILLGNGQVKFSTSPLYYSGDEAQILSGLARQGNGAVAKLQTMLEQAGLLDPHSKSLIQDAVGPETIAAFRQLLSISNAAGQNWQEVLGGRLHSAQAQPPADQFAARTPLQVKLTSPQDLEAVLQNSAKTLYGGNLPPDAVQNFIKAYQYGEAQSQIADYNTTGLSSGGQTAGGGTFTAPTDPSVAAQNYIKTTFPADYAAAGVGERFNQWMGLLNQNLAGGESQAQR